MIRGGSDRLCRVIQFTNRPENEGAMNSELFRGFLPIENIFKKGELKVW